MGQGFSREMDVVRYRYIYKEREEGCGCCTWQGFRKRMKIEEVCKDLLMVPPDDFMMGKSFAFIARFSGHDKE